jgi:serine/threonine protein kinase
MISHPQIVSLVDIYYTPRNCYIVMEYCEGGSIQSIIDAKTPFNWSRAALQIGAACQYLASCKVMHRDIKPANIFLSG